MAHSVAFDTLAYAKKLESCGIAVKQAEAHAEALADVLELNFFSKKEAETSYDKLSNKIDQLDIKINYVKTEIQQDVNQVKTEIQQDINHVKTEMQQDINHVKIDMIKWVIGVAFAQTALILSVLKFFH